MKKILFAASALSLMAAPALAQPIVGDMMGMGGPGGPRSCVSGGQFVPCPPPGGMMGGPGMGGPGMGGPGMRGGDMGAAPQRRMSRAEMRRMRAQGGQGGMAEDEGM